MAEESQNNLRFSVEESVWLKEGQVVDEILSMSLEPDISIDENKHYVSVRGALILNGEYQPLQNEEKEDEQEIDDSQSLHDQVSFRSIDELSLSESGVAHISHRFPIDITIPLSRIQKLDEIYVNVEAFDYTLPEQNRLQLTADISISGMMEEGDTRDTEAEESKKKEEVEGFEESFAREVEDEAKPVSRSDETEDVHAPFQYEAYRQADSGESEDDEFAFSDESHGPLIEMKTRPESLQHNDLRQDAIAEEANVDPEYEDDDYKYEDDDEEGQRETEEAPREENALYLTKMLTKDEEEFSKLKMCIIQPGESLDMIAERYDLQLSQLVSMNRLTSEEIEEGQILYIPDSASAQ